MTALASLRSPLQLGIGIAVALTGMLTIGLAFSSTADVLSPASVDETQTAAVEPAGSFSQSLGVAGGIVLAAGLGIAFLAFSDFGRTTRR